MRKYEEYKNSNELWYKEIPNNWNILRLKDITRNLTSGATPSSGNATYYNDGTINWLNTGDLNDGIIINTVKKLNKDVFKDYPNLKIQKKGTLVIAMYGATIGKLGLLDIDATTNQACCCLNLSKSFNSKYYFYLLLSNKQNIISLSVGGTQPNVSQSILAHIKLIAPPFSEQQAIANYLDAKTQAIDKKVSLLEQKIETYKKLKNTIIAKAVTQGITNQELSINDLGFKTPANWTKYRLKDLGKLYSGLSGKSGDDFNQEENPNNRGFIPFTNIANNTYLKKDHLGTVVVNPGEKQNKVRKGDLFFLMSSEGYGDIGKTAVLADNIEEAYLNSFCKGYRVNQNKCNPYFLNYLLLSNIYRQRLIVEGKGFTRINLKMEKVTDFEIFLPPTLSEQKEIANYIDLKTTTIDAIVSNISKQIETLKQLRKTLINDVVTGKIKVIE